MGKGSLVTDESMIPLIMHRTSVLHWQEHGVARDEIDRRLHTHLVDHVLLSSPNTSLNFHLSPLTE